MVFLSREWRVASPQRAGSSTAGIRKQAGNSGVDTRFPHPANVDPKLGPKAAKPGNTVVARRGDPARTIPNSTSFTGAPATQNLTTLDRAELSTVSILQAYWRSGRRPAKSRVTFNTRPTMCTTSTLSLIHISEPTRLLSISYAVFCLK